MKKLRRAIGSLKSIGLHADSSNNTDILNYGSPHRPRSLSTSTISRAVNHEGFYVSYDDESLNAEASVINYIDPLRLEDHLFTKLHKWTYLGDLSKVRKFIKKVDINAKDSDSRTCLHLCSYEGHIDILLLLLCSGANVDLKDRDGRTSIFKATERSHLGIVQILLQHKADYHVRDNLENSLLHVAVQAGSIDLTELYLSMGLGGLLQNTYGQTPLHIAASNVQIEISKALLAQGEFDIDLKDKDGVTPVMLAVKSGCRPLLDILIEAGADINLQDCSGWNAASYARFSGYSELHAYLSSLSEKINVFQVSNDEKSYEMIGLNRSDCEHLPFPIKSNKLPDDINFKDAPLDALEDSWNDDSESSVVHPKTKTDMKNLFTSENKNCSPSKSPFVGLSSSLTSLGPPKPPRLYTSTPNLSEDSLYFNTKKAYITTKNIDADLILCQSKTDEKNEKNEISVSGENNGAFSHLDTATIKITNNLYTRDLNAELPLLHDNDNSVFFSNLTDDDDVAFEDESDALPSSEDENEARKCIKEHLSIIELPMYEISASKQIVEDLEVNNILNSESKADILKEASEVHICSNSMPNVIDATNIYIKSEIVEGNFETGETKNVDFINLKETNSVALNHFQSLGNPKCKEVDNNQSSIKKATKEDLVPALAVQESECQIPDKVCKVAMQRMNTLHQIDEMWEANACLEVQDVSLNDSFGSSENESIKVNYIDNMEPKKFFFGDSKKKLFNCSEDYDSTDNVSKFKIDIIDNTVPFEKASGDINELGLRALNSFLDIEISEENYESMVKKYINTLQLPQQSEDLEILVRKLRILLNREHLKNSSLKSTIKLETFGDNYLRKQLDQRENEISQLFREVSKFSSLLKNMSYKNTMSEHEKLFSSTCLNKTLKKVSSLEKEKEILQCIAVENQYQMSKLKDAIELGKSMCTSSEDKLNDHSARLENEYSQTEILPIVSTECQTTLLEDNGLRIVSVTNVANSSSQFNINTDENFAQTSLEWNGKKPDLVSFGTQTMEIYYKMKENSCQTDEETNAFKFIPDCKEINSDILRSTDKIEYKVSLNNLSTQTDTVLASIESEVLQVDASNLLSQTVPPRSYFVNDENRETIRKLIDSCCQTENNVSKKYSQTEFTFSECGAKPNVDVVFQTPHILSLQTNGTQTSLDFENSYTQTSDTKRYCCESCDISLSTEEVIQADKEAQTDFNEKPSMETNILSSILMEPMADLLISMNDLKDTIHIKESSDPLNKFTVINHLDKFSNCQELMLLKLGQLESFMHDLANPDSIITELKSNRELITKMAQHIGNVNQMEQDLKTNSSKSLDILAENKSVVNSIRIGTLEIPNQVSKMLSNSTEKLSAVFVSKMDEQQEMITKDSKYVGSKITQLDSKIQVLKDDFSTSGSKLNEMSGNVDILIKEQAKNGDIISKLTENEKYLKHHFQLLEKGMEEASSESNQKVIKSLKLLISNVDETVAENFQIVLNLLKDFEGNLIAKVNEIHKSELDTRSNETSDLSKKLTELQSSLAAFRTCFEANRELLSNSVFDCGVIEAIRGGDDQALTSLNIQNKSVLKSIESCKCMLDKIIRNQEDSVLNNEFRKAGSQEEIKTYLTDNKLYENKIEVLKTECEMLRNQIMSKNECLNMEVELKKNIEKRLDSLVQEYQKMCNDFLNLKSAHDKLLEQQNNFLKCQPRNANLEIINEGMKSELCNLEQNLISVKEENKSLNDELKRFNDVNDSKLKEYESCIENLKSLNSNYEKRIGVLMQHHIEPKLSTNIENGLFHEIQDLSVSKKAVECALKEKRKTVLEMKSRITELESEKEELEADVILKTSLLTKLKRDYSSQQKTICELKQNLNDQINRNETTQELEHKLGELEYEISNKRTLILSLRERVSGLAQEKRELANTLSLKHAENLNSEVLMKEREAAVQTSKELQYQLESITRNIKQEFIPKSKLDDFYQDVESYFESVLAEKKQLWTSVAKEELKVKERKNVLLKEREMSFKNKITSLQEEIKLLKSNLLSTDRDGQLWRSRYNQLFQECHKVSHGQRNEKSKWTMDTSSCVSDTALKPNKKTSTALTDETQFQNVLSEIDVLLKNPYEDSFFVKNSQPFTQTDTSLHQNTLENLSDHLSSSETPFKSSSFLNFLHSNKRSGLNVLQLDSGIESTHKMVNSSFDITSPSIQKSFESFADSFKAKYG